MYVYYKATVKISYIEELVIQNIKNNKFKTIYNHDFV